MGDKKCLALFSGGLDSMLSIKIISSQNIDVHAINIDIGFGANKEKFEIMKRRANLAGGSFEVINTRSAYLKEVLFSPKFGYGKEFNPCIDCHGFMLRTAISMLEHYKADFVISGEVVGQRPMSQRNDAMVHVKNLAGDIDDIVLRPLCAKLLKPTKPEKEGWVDRQKLFDFNGRGRTRQMELAKEFGFSDYESPGGGCPYTMKSFSNRIRDFIKFDGKMNEEDLQSLRFGRHLRLKNGAKMIIGRDENDNAKLKSLNCPNLISINFDNVIGAYSLISKNACEEDLNLAAKLAITYCKNEFGKTYIAKIGDKIIKTSPLQSKDMAKEFFIE